MVVREMGSGGKDWRVDPFPSRKVDSEKDEVIAAPQACIADPHLHKSS